MWLSLHWLSGCLFWEGVTAEGNISISRRVPKFFSSSHHDCLQGGKKSVWSKKLDVRVGCAWTRLLSVTERQRGGVARGAPDKNGKTRGNNTWKDCWGAEVPGDCGGKTVWFVDLPTDNFNQKKHWTVTLQPARLLLFFLSFFFLAAISEKDLQETGTTSAAVSDNNMIWDDSILHHFLNYCLKMFWFFLQTICF